MILQAISIEVHLHGVVPVYISVVEKCTILVDLVILAFIMHSLLFSHSFELLLGGITGYYKGITR